jgi:hypothetical protein
MAHEWTTVRRFVRDGTARTSPGAVKIKITKKITNPSTAKVSLKLIDH